MKTVARITLLIVLSACAGNKKDYPAATDALDAGREYLNACMEGDFSRAAFYTVPDDANKRLLNDTEIAYRSRDKEGRQQLRTASININEIKKNNDTLTMIRYHFSFDTAGHTIFVVKRGGNWLVDQSKL